LVSEQDPARSATALAAPSRVRSTGKYTLSISTKIKELKNLKKYVYI
jgi:hypothetical protein